MELAEKLDAVEEIKKLKARYFRFVDTKQFDAFRDLFLPEARFDGEGAGMGPIADRDAFIAQSIAGLTGCVSVHHGHCPEVELDSETTATGIWAMEDMLQWGAGPVRSLHGMGHYHETYEKRDGRWYIASWQLKRLRVDMVPA